MHLPREWAGSGWSGRRAVAAGGDRPGDVGGDGDGVNCRAVEYSLSGRGCHCGGELRKKMAMTKFNLIIKIDHGLRIIGFQIHILWSTTLCTQC